MSRTNFNLGRLADDFFFFDSLPLLRRELPPAPQVPQLLSLALRAAAVVSFEESGYFSFRFLPLMVLPETLSLLRFRLASRLGGSLPTRVLLEARSLQLSPVMRGGL
jgi:hypothetical protein